MWSASIETLDAGRIQQARLLREGETLRSSEVFELWRVEASFRTFFDELLAAAPYEAFLWETPPVTRKTLDREFELVLVESRALAAMRPDPHAFREHLGPMDADQGIASFWNLGHDAYLVAPRPLAELSVYPHLAAFARGAPEPQRHALWRAVGAAVDEHAGERPLWVSTSGLGVAWLHVRLDSRPKYYSYRPYRSAR